MSVFPAVILKRSSRLELRVSCGLPEGHMSPVVKGLHLGAVNCKTREASIECSVAVSNKQ